MITINLYFKQAWQLMKQNRFFSAVYIIGTGLAISMVMVLAVVYYIRTANIAPEYIGTGCAIWILSSTSIMKVMAHTAAH